MKKTLIALLLLTSCSLDRPIAATSNQVGEKTGTATAATLFGITISGDASARTAAKNGGISRISTVDLRTQNFAFILILNTCTVTGE